MTGGRRANVNPPAPPELAAQIITAVYGHVEFELASLRAHLLERLDEPSDEYIWERAERIVADEIDATSAAELVAQCGRALSRAVDDLVQFGEGCRDALDDLQQNRAESWIFGAIRHQLAFDTAWDTLDERHGVERHECRV